MRTILRSYEPVFGGIVAALAAAVACLVLLMPSQPGSHRGMAYLFGYCGSGNLWGVLQVVGYRHARRKNIQLAEPVMDTALGCVLVGLMLALVTLCLFEFAHDRWYTIATGAIGEAKQ